jgi:hypothetical protein
MQKVKKKPKRAISKLVFFVSRPDFFFAFAILVESIDRIRFNLKVGVSVSLAF